MRSSFPTFAAGCLLPALVIVPACRRDAPTATSKSAGGRSSATSAATSARVLCTAGEKRAHVLDLRIVSHADFRPLLRKSGEDADESANGEGQAYDFDVRIKGELDATAVEATAEVCTWAWKLASGAVTFMAAEAEEGEQSEAIREALAAPAFVDVGDRGDVRAVRLHQRLGLLQRSLVRSVLAAIQFVSPDKHGAKRWATREADPTGFHEAAYVFEAGAPDGGLPAVRKTKQRYFPDEPRAGEIVLERVVKVEGGWLAQWSPERGLEAMRGEEVQTTLIRGMEVARGKLVMTLRRAALAKVAVAELAALRSMHAGKELAPPTALYVAAGPEAEEITHRTELGKETKASLLAWLDRDEKKGVADDGPLYLKLKALVFLQPAVSAELGQRLAKAADGSLSLRLLAGALGSVGHAEAQGALIAAIRARPKEWRPVVQILSMLVDAERPTEAAEALARELLASPEENIANTAALVLGALANRLAKHAPARADLIATFLLTRLQAASGGQRPLLLQALGNTGSPRTVAALRAHLASPEAPLRAAAASGLRHIRTAEVDALLLEALAKDRDASVRSEAASALGSRPAARATIDALKLAFAKDPSVDVRRPSLRALWEAREAFPEVVPLVEAAKDDESEEIRKSARSMLTVE